MLGVCFKATSSTDSVCLHCPNNISIGQILTGLCTQHRPTCCKRVIFCRASRVGGLYKAPVVWGSPASGSLNRTPETGSLLRERDKEEATLKAASEEMTRI